MILVCQLGRTDSDRHLLCCEHSLLGWLVLFDAVWRNYYPLLKKRFVLFSDRQINSSTSTCVSFYLSIFFLGYDESLNYWTFDFFYFTEVLRFSCRAEKRNLFLHGVLPFKIQCITTSHPAHPITALHHIREFYTGTLLPAYVTDVLYLLYFYKKKKMQTVTFPFSKIYVVLFLLVWSAACIAWT